MKRKLLLFISVGLVFVLVAVSLTACGENPDTPATTAEQKVDEAKDDASKQEVDAKTDAEVPDVEEVKADEDKDAKTDEKAEEKAEDKADEKVEDKADEKVAPAFLGSWTLDKVYSVEGDKEVELKKDEAQSVYGAGTSVITFAEGGKASTETTDGSDSFIEDGTWKQDKDDTIIYKEGTLTLEFEYVDDMLVRTFESEEKDAMYKNLKFTYVRVDDKTEVKDDRADEKAEDKKDDEKKAEDKDSKDAVDKGIENKDAEAAEDAVEAPEDAADKDSAN